VTLHVWLPALRSGSGADIYTQRLAEGLIRKGARATVTWFDARYELLPFLLPAGAPPGIDIVHAGTWTGFAFRQEGLPLVVTAHHCVLDPDWLRRSSLAQRLYYRHWIQGFEKRTFRYATRITAVSDYTRRALERAYRIGSCRVIHNWVDTGCFVPRSAPPARPFRLLFVGNLIRRKGADLLPEIMRRLGPDFELLFTGGLRGAASSRGLPANMIPVGRVPDDRGMAELYNSCHALLFPSRLEGLGYAPLEAQACGRPVITTRISALPEAVVDGTTGLLCPADDVDAFVAACRRLAADRALHDRMGQAARQHVVERFSADVALKAYLDLYGEALAATRGATAA
jgi:glycosyltransferase involved in cell wall biosynthesis